MKKNIEEKTIFDKIFTTSSRTYFLQNGLQLASSLLDNTGQKLTVISEDDLSDFEKIIDYVPLKEEANISLFRNNFKDKYKEKYKFMPYTMKMDIWCMKIAAIRQFLLDNPEGFYLLLDSDCYIRNSNFAKVVNQFVKPAQDYDCGLFRRVDTFLHPETGFVTFSNSNRLSKAFDDMYIQILSGQFYELPSWTDDSLIDLAINQNKFSALDFCDHYGLVTSNPMYESQLLESFLHFKGPRKGKYSKFKFFSGRYK